MDAAHSTGHMDATHSPDHVAATHSPDNVNAIRPHDHVGAAHSRDHVDATHSTVDTDPPRYRFISSSSRRTTFFEFIEAWCTVNPVLEILLSWLLGPNSPTQWGTYGLISYLDIFTSDLDIDTVLGHIDTVMLALTNKKGVEATREVKQALAADWSAVALSAAMICQLGITGLSLPNLASVHWTAKAFFVVSLVAGALSVFYACRLQQHITGLLTPEAIIAWLSQLTAEGYRELRAIDHMFHRMMLEQRKRGSTEPASERIQRDKVVKEFIEWHRTSIRDHKRRASPTAAVMIKTPYRLLVISLGAFLAGLGIYLGCLWQRHLEVPWSKNESLNVLISYIVFTGWWGIFLTGQEISGALETAPIQRWQAYFSRNPGQDGQSDSGSVFEAHKKEKGKFASEIELAIDSLMTGFKELIRAQERSTAALCELLEEHRGRGPRTEGGRTG